MCLDILNSAHYSTELIREVVRPLTFKGPKAFYYKFLISAFKSTCLDQFDNNSCICVYLHCMFFFSNKTSLYLCRIISRRSLEMCK